MTAVPLIANSPAEPRLVMPGGKVAIIAPVDGDTRLAQEYRAQGWRCVAVRLGGGHAPAPGHLPHRSGYGEEFVHDEGLRHTLERLRVSEVTSVVAGSHRGVALADRLAAELDLAGNDPATSWLRTDRGVQAAALRDAGLSAPRTLSTSSLTQALKWAGFCGMDRFVLASADSAVPLEPALCRTTTELRDAWERLRAEAPRHTDDPEFVVQEHVPGARYLIDTVSGPVERHPVVVGLWRETLTEDGLHQRTDAVPGTDPHARSLKQFALRALPVLGIGLGPARLHVALAPGSGATLLRAQAYVQEGPTGPLHGHACDPVRAAATADVAGLVRPVALPRRFTTRMTLAAGDDGFVDARVLRRLRSLPAVAHVCPGLTAGAPVRRTVDEASSPGHVVLDGQDRRTVEDTYRSIRLMETGGLYAGA
ncbi:hypothetical protein ABT160_08060 [Streptomyces sp. NPDC001941]|uniref:hypothetical protein n=1 Tax=Streptomyces sp. NPDC001941 TaxID=3154659 RepID=UPI00331DA13F